MTLTQVTEALAALATAREPPPGRMALAYRAMEAERKRAERLQDTTGHQVALWAARRIRAACRRAGARPDMEPVGCGWILRHDGGERRAAAHVSLRIWLPHDGSERAVVVVSCEPRSAEHLEEWCWLSAARIVAWAGAVSVRRGKR